MERETYQVEIPYPFKMPKLHHISTRLSSYEINKLDDLCVMVHEATEGAVKAERSDCLRWLIMTAWVNFS
ncbi:MAG: hypothetical protein OXL41_10370 [Nitrospinae bacterium]|nr:hypothetical protein [Nitrospinota bacterium]